MFRGFINFDFSKDFLSSLFTFDRLRAAWMLFSRAAFWTVLQGASMAAFIGLRGAPPGRMIPDVRPGAASMQVRSAKKLRAIFVASLPGMDAAPRPVWGYHSPGHRPTNAIQYESDNIFSPFSSPVPKICFGDQRHPGCLSNVGVDGRIRTGDGAPRANGGGV